jgi:hypothetical protein
MFTFTHPKTSRKCACAAVPVLVVCALVLLSGCLALPAGQTPSTVTALVESTSSIPATSAATSQPATVPTAPRAANTPTAEPPAPAATSPTALEPPTPSATDATASYWPCQPSDEPDMFVMGAPDGGSLPSICITGFPPRSEVDLAVTLPDGENKYFTELMDEKGIAMVAWSSETAFPEGTYTFEVTQGDLSAIVSVEVATGAEPREPTPERRAGEPSIEVYPVGDSGSEFEVALSGFEPNQEVELTLSVATDETGTDFEEIDWLYLQVDEKGATTYPLAIEPSDWPSSLFALEYWPEDGEPIYAEFQVE